MRRTGTGEVPAAPMMGFAASLVEAEPQPAMLRTVTSMSPAKGALRWTSFMNACRKPTTVTWNGLVA